MKNIPISKQSKKARKQYFASKRGNWNGVDPVSRVTPSGKEYNRNKEKKAARREYYGFSERAA